MRAPGTDAYADEALRTDTYVDWLLDTADARRRASAQAPEADPAMVMAARTLRETLGRAHPSFRFEERLSQRLAELALAMRRGAAVGGGPDGHAAAHPAEVGLGWAATLVALRDRRPGGQVVAFPAPAAVVTDGQAAASGRAGVRPAIAGGAVASAAISIAAAALVAWRRSHVRRGIV